MPPRVVAARAGDMDRDAEGSSRIAKSWACMVSRDTNYPVRQRRAIRRRVLGSQACSRVCTEVGKSG